MIRNATHCLSDEQWRAIAALELKEGRDWPRFKSALEAIERQLTEDMMSAEPDALDRYRQHICSLRDLRELFGDAVLRYQREG